MDGEIASLPRPDVATLIRWILTEGRDAPSPIRFINGVCGHLVDIGLPLWRATIYITTLHPQIRGYGWRWWRDRGLTEEVRIAQGTELSPGYIASPLRRTIETGEVLRRHLDNAPSGFPVLDEFHAEGCTDYLVAPLNRLGSRYPVVAWATDREGGFTEADLAIFEEIRPALAAVIEATMIRRTARGLFAIYHGDHVGERVFDGQILRGHLEPMRAVIMATDLRGFTAISDRLPGETMIGVLDSYFEHVAASVSNAGGHVLKFIGDGVLAIFGTDGARDEVAAASAIMAARSITSRLAAHNGASTDGAGVVLKAGIGLHLGTVMYGNVGAPDRLDFTAVGPAVNLAFRLEGLTKELKRPVLASHAVAAASREALPSLGFHPIRGLSEDEEVFAVPAS